MKKTVYPKTKRITDSKTIITEKLDWSNLWIFKLDWNIIVAQRNNIYRFDELTSKKSYKWLYGRLQENKDNLDLCEWSWIFWEWIWMWQIKYWESLDKKFYMFAKANIDELLDVRNINYQKQLFIYPFESQEIPDCIGVVNTVIETNTSIDKDSLDKIYEGYIARVNRKVEWFIINTQWNITKYVRYKNGILKEHSS